MKLVATFCRGRDEGDPKTAAPVSEKVRQTGCSVVLVGPQLRICKHIDRHEEESISQTLVSPGQCIVTVIRCQSEGAVIPHRGAYRHDADHEQDTGRNKLSLDQL